MDTVAMHIADGIIDGPTSAVFAAVALALLAACVVKARDDLDERLVPMAGLTAAFIFAVQMLNFAVLPGVSGHLLGGAMAAALVGPWVGALCVSTVLIVQALMFADGGITALGLSIVNMALIGALVTYGILRLLLKLLPRTRSGVTVAVFVTSVVSVVAGAAGFVLQFAIGGVADFGPGLGAIATGMLGIHLLIGVGEGVITATTVLAVATARPDLVHALRGHTLPHRPAVAGGAE
ncbi:cobalt/nickel transport system permease protein [Stackebrandtia albiflava]|uniref:Cobalt/nickel transport system permease protein n=1 Tax=Stackebrandtia albiflava TaxID=406432 RepID=A0A562URL8_9ACTN|nr:energy-coupling factor ABC transporter permease [Stackebrandtia albiflava]TWJ08256.1 cobalt/nickel transport system permease protein [Stackebrandtia albiflava]